MYGGLQVKNDKSFHLSALVRGRLVSSTLAIYHDHDTSTYTEIKLGIQIENTEYNVHIALCFLHTVVLTFDICFNMWGTYRLNF